MALEKKKDLQLHFNVLTTSSSILKACTREDESGRTGMQPYKRTARRITERLAKTFFFVLSYRKNKRRNRRAIIQRDKLSETDRQEDGETGK